MNKFEILILAGGKGSRMKSNKPKLLHKINGVSILDMVIKKALKLKPCKLNVIINKQYELTKKYLNVDFFKQNKPLGTGHAVKTFLKKKIKKDLLIMMGDAPKINMSSLKKIIVKMKKNCNYILAARIKKIHLTVF